MGRLQLRSSAYRRIEKLPAPFAAEVRTQVGWTQSKESLLERAAGVRDRWHVLGHRQTQDDRLRLRTTWLSGIESGRSAVVLDYAVGNEPLPATRASAMSLMRRLVYFDGAPPLRTLVKERFAGAPPRPALPAPTDVAGMQSRFAALLVENPLLERWPVVLGPVAIAIDGVKVHFVDAMGRRIPAAGSFRHGWHVSALAGGGMLSAFGLWDGHAFDPVSVEHEGRLFSLAHVGGAAHAVEGGLSACPHPKSHVNGMPSLRSPRSERIAVCRLPRNYGPRRKSRPRPNRLSARCYGLRH